MFSVLEALRSLKAQTPYITKHEFYPRSLEQLSHFKQQLFFHLRRKISSVSRHSSCESCGLSSSEDQRSGKVSPTVKKKKKPYEIQLHLPYRCQLGSYTGKRPGSPGEQPPPYRPYLQTRVAFTQGCWHLQVGQLQHHVCAPGMDHGHGHHGHGHHAGAEPQSPGSCCLTSSSLRNHSGSF